jgi:hypothetical protein
MLSRHRFLNVALLVLLLLSLTTVSVHVATHASADLQSCDLCSGHADPSHAIPVADTLVLPPATFLVPAATPALAPASSRERYYHQRAPPDIA